jgi:hypothetical protein
MFDLGPDLPERGRHGALYREINRLRNAIRALIPIPSLNILTGMSAIGTTREALNLPGDAPKTIQWRGEWSATESYKENDLVIRGSANPADADITDTVAILQDGTKAGLYIAIRDMDANHEPHEPPDPDYWETMARFATPIFTVRHPSSTKKVYIDATGPSGSVILQLSQCNNKDLRIQEMPVCINGVQKKIMLICSDPYA